MTSTAPTSRYAPHVFLSSRPFSASILNSRRTFEKLLLAPDKSECVADSCVVWCRTGGACSWSAF